MLLPIIKTQENALQMIKQSMETKTPFPLKGIEHTYVKHEIFDICKYCSYGKNNLMHS